MKKSKFEKAASKFGKYNAETKSLAKKASGRTFKFIDQESRIVIRVKAPGQDWANLYTPVYDNTSVGDLCELISRTTRSFKSEVDVPPKLKGATSAGSFEDLISKEGARLEKKNSLSLGRYPVASVMIKGDKFPRQVPSLPDYEGVFPNGRQFIFEAKVCSSSSFEVRKDKIKPKQVSHMIKRSRFNVVCFLLLHFNERKGATFYDPAETFAVPIAAGNKFWEKYAADKKGKGAGSITREEARKTGEEVMWHLPPRCKVVRPDLWSLLKKFVDIHP